MKPKNETKEAFNLRMRTYNRQRYLKNPEKIKQANERWRKADPLRYKAIIRHNAWNRYGIKKSNGDKFTHDDFDIILSSQNGKCAICDRHQSELSRSLGVDHDHNTGAIRGLLCSGCNARVATVEDAAWMEKCRRYLSRCTR